MKGPLAIEKSNFLIEPIDTPFSSRLSKDCCCRSGADTGESECRVMTQPRFPSALLLWTHRYGYRRAPQAEWRGEWRKERRTENGCWQEEKRIIDEMIQKEVDREGGGRLWWIRASDQMSKRQQPHLQAHQPTLRKERKRESVRVRGKEGRDRHRRHPTMRNHRLINFRPFNERCSARPGGIKSVTPSLSAGAAIHCNSHFSISAKDLMAEEQWTHHAHTHTLTFLFNCFCCLFHHWHHERVIKSNTLSEALLKWVHWSPVVSLTPGVLCL